VFFQLLYYILKVIVFHGLHELISIAKVLFRGTVLATISKIITTSTVVQNERQVWYTTGVLSALILPDSADTH
jgi:hypothetical protein